MREKKRQQKKHTCKEEEGDKCVICFEVLLAVHHLQLECGHVFHDKCIRRWLREKSTCPTCRDHVFLS